MSVTDLANANVLSSRTSTCTERSLGSVRVGSGALFSKTPIASPPPRTNSSPRVLTPRRLLSSKSTGLMQALSSGYAYCPSTFSTNASVPSLRGSLQGISTPVSAPFGTATCGVDISAPDFFTGTDSIPSGIQSVPQMVPGIQSVPASVVVPVAPSSPVVREATRRRVVEPPVSLYRDTLECFIRSMASELADLRHAIYEERESRNPRKWSIHAERDARRTVDTKLDILASELQNCKERFVSYNSLPNGDLRKALDKIEGRGNIHVDITSDDAGSVQLNRPILFQRRTAGDPPTAEFAQPELVHNICTDLAEVATLFDCPVVVEGHTKGGEGEFWQALANNRARLVAEKLVNLGIDAEKISCQGRPGKIGVNNSCTIVRLGIPGMGHHPVQSWPQAVVVETAPLVETVVGPEKPETTPLTAGFIPGTQTVFVETAQQPMRFRSSRTPSPCVSRSASVSRILPAPQGASPRLTRSTSRTLVL